MTSDRFFAGLVAAIRAVDEADDPNAPTRLTVDRVALNRAFQKALMSPAGQFVDRKRLAIDYDPLYDVSPWFERALTRAQRDLLIGFPNPTYSTVEIKLRREQAEHLLELTGQRDQFIGLARALMTNIAVPQF